jgi:hypothetical protein
MKSPESVLDFTQHSWFIKAKQIQRLQFDLSAIFETCGLKQNTPYEIFQTPDVLTIKSNAALLTRMRQVEPEILDALATKGWHIQHLKFLVTKQDRLLNTRLGKNIWINPNELRYGKRSLPTQAQRELIFNKPKKPS